MFSFLKRKKKPEEPRITIRENVSSVWFYHFAFDGKPLCGTKDLTMPTNIRIEDWGYVSDHIGERYCKECTKAYQIMKNERIVK